MFQQNYLDFLVFIQYVKLDLVHLHMTKFSI